MTPTFRFWGGLGSFTPKKPSTFQKMTPPNARPQKFSVFDPLFDPIFTPFSTQFSQKTLPGRDFLLYSIFAQNSLILRYFRSRLIKNRAPPLVFIDFSERTFYVVVWFCIVRSMCDTMLAIRTVDAKMGDDIKSSCIR